LAGLKFAIFFSFSFCLLRLGVPQAILLIMATLSCGFLKVSCSKIPRRAFAGIRTRDPLVESPFGYDALATPRFRDFLYPKNFNVINQSSKCHKKAILGLSNV
jgi:hypothetical protein